MADLELVLALVRLLIEMIMAFLMHWFKYLIMPMF